MNTTFRKTGVSNLEKLKETGTYYARVKVKGRSGGGRGRRGRSGPERTRPAFTLLISGACPSPPRRHASHARLEGTATLDWRRVLIDRAANY